MKSKFLMLNVDKTEVLFIGKPSDDAFCNLSIDIADSLEFILKDVVRFLDASLDAPLSTQSTII